MKQIMITSISKEIQEDDFDKGLIGSRTSVFVDEVCERFDCPEDMFDYLAQAGLELSKRNNFSVLNDGRINYSRMEDEDGNTISEEEFIKFNKGERTLFAADYDIMIDYIDVTIPTVSELVQDFGIKEA